MSAIEVLQDIVGDEVEQIFRALQCSDIEFSQRQAALIRQMCIQAWKCGFELSSTLEQQVKPHE